MADEAKTVLIVEDPTSPANIFCEEVVAGYAGQAWAIVTTIC